MSWTKRLVLGISAAILVVGGMAGGFHLWGPRRTPAVQPRLSTITPEGLTAFIDAFNASSDRTRVLALLSPT